MLMNQGPNKEINIEEKYNLKLPIKQSKELAALETKLDESKAFQSDTEKYMGTLIDSDKTLPDAARNILKRFLIRDVAVKLTALKDSADKFNMAKNLPSFKKCILVLSQCLTRATDWDNSRPRKPKNGDSNNYNSLTQYLNNLDNQDDDGGNNSQS
ncbi:hypothetical protein HCN44_003388 [Aphidius gifuensis]|uniref:Uncharacterized protein n=1 Tax=Aphidius gifuensis TaxID=684658 RepID=A0A834XXW3_APHGI|nr:hypothetical protein HCN44_003388 [Aphidius gifuensis]